MILFLFSSNINRPPTFLICGDSGNRIRNTATMALRVNETARTSPPNTLGITMGSAWWRTTHKWLIAARDSLTATTKILRMWVPSLTTVTATTSMTITIRAIARSRQNTNLTTKCRMNRKFRLFSNNDRKKTRLIMRRRKSKNLKKSVQCSTSMYNPIIVPVKNRRWLQVCSN